MDGKSFIELAKDAEEYVVNIRRILHQHPELSLRETRTKDLICSELNKLGIPYVTFDDNCVVGIMTGGNAGEDALKIAIRADMDALPIQEETQLPFRSTVPNVMHACGHDGHVAMLLGTASVLRTRRDSLSGIVYLCFQAAEEIEKGANTIVRYLKSIGGVDCAIAAHLWAELESGRISVKEGARMANSDRFWIAVKGRGGHASRPDLCIDPIKPICQLILDISAIPSNRVKAIEPCVVHVGHVNAGSVGNIIPEEARLMGGFRTFSSENRKRVATVIAEIVRGIEQAYGVQISVDFETGAPMIYNDREHVLLAQQVVEKTGLFELDDFHPIMASDNFGEFLKEFRGFMCYMGVRNEEKGAKYTHHNPKFDIDEDVLYKGVGFFAQFVQDFFQGSKD